jgi:MoaA/NifB/PqqE/SkfB family radical SAM enzyme
VPQLAQPLNQCIELGRRRGLATLQVNLGYRCNRSCVHCHVNAGPGRTEQMDDATIELIPQVLAVLARFHTWRKG